MNILLIDDHELIIEGTISMLQKQFSQAQIIIAKTVEDSLNKVSTHQPEIVIVDLSIPVDQDSLAQVENGLLLLKKLMISYPDLNIMVQSSNTKALIRIKNKIDEHQGGFTIADKSMSSAQMLNMLNWSIEGVTHTKNINTDIELKHE